MLLYMITNNCEIASFVTSCGVDRVMVDCEHIGKYNRQGHLNTLISHHTVEDVKKVRKNVPTGSLMVRSNPIHAESEMEIKSIIDSGADAIMLPMFRSLKEVETFIRLVNGQAKVNLLVETSQALDMTEEISATEDVDEVHFGLNDLHIDFDLKFIFEPLTRGLLDHACSVYSKSNKKFGVGGVACIGEGAIPAELILNEHVRLGSEAVILSRTFHRKADNLSELMSQIDFPMEVNRLRKTHREIQEKTGAELLRTHHSFKREVMKIVASG